MLKMLMSPPQKFLQPHTDFQLTIKKATFDQIVFDTF